MLKLVFLVCCAAAVLAEDSCIDQVATCMKTAKAKLDADRKTKMVAWTAKAAERKAKGEAFKAQADACFTNNGCTAPVMPTFNFTKNATWAAGKNATWAAGKNVNNNETAKFKADMVKMKTCLKQSASLVATCVSTTAGVAFTFPPMPENASAEFEQHFGAGAHHSGAWGQQGGPWEHSGESHEGGPPHEGGDHHDGPHENGDHQDRKHEGGDRHDGPWGHIDFAAKFCGGNNDSAEKAQTCLKGLKPTPSPTTSSPAPRPVYQGGSHSKEHGMGHGKGKMCEVRDNCTKALNDTCQQQLKKIKEALCPCAKSSSTKDAFNKCMAPEATASVQKRNAVPHPQLAASGPAPAGGRQFNSAMIGPEIFCMDPCDPQPKVEKAFGGFQLHPANGGAPTKQAAPANVASKVASVKETNLHKP